MKQRNRNALMLMLLTVLCLGLPAETFTAQSFEADTNDTWSYTANPAGMNRLVWWGSSNQAMGGANAQSGLWYWASWDLDNSEYSLTFSPVDLPFGYLYTLKFYYYTNGLNPATDYCKYAVQYDNGTEWSNWTNLSPDTDAWNLVSLEIPAYANQLRLKVAAQYDGFAKYAHWDSFTLERIPTPATAPIIYNQSAAQRTDGSGLVDIWYDLYDANGDACSITLQLSEDAGASFNSTLTPANLSGDIGEGILSATGKHIIWNAGAEGIPFDNNQFKLRIAADDGYLPPIPENFVFVEGGTFNNGTSDVTLSSFYIDKYELTQAGYQAVMGTNPATGYGVGSNYPVYYVSWFNAIEYCNRRSLLEGITPCYSYSTYGTNPDNWPTDWNSNSEFHINVSCNWTAIGYRLPTEMEWQFTARGGNQTHNYTYSGSNDLNLVAWHGSNSNGISHQVGTKGVNELGVYDMSGNLLEWVWDIYGNYPSTPQFNPTGAASGINRVYRGGSWFDYGIYCQVDTRNEFNSGLIHNRFGYRICRNSP